MDVHDPCVNSEEARHEYGITPVREPEPRVYDAIIIAVGHRQFADMGSAEIHALGIDRHDPGSAKHGLESARPNGRATMTSFDRITCNPAVLNGQPSIRGMRLTVRRVIEALALYPNWDDLRAEYPELEPEDIRRALEFAAQNLDDQVFRLEPA